MKKKEGKGEGKEEEQQHEVWKRGKETVRKGNERVGGKIRIRCGQEGRKERME